jgi:hypothetical protein
MTKKEIVIRHTVDDLMGCYEENMFRTPELRDYYVDEKDRNTPIGQNLLDEMRNIIKSRTENIDPNDSSLMTYIREYLNRVCAANVDEIINKLKVLNYSTRKHFDLLANELVIKSLNDAMAYRGLESKDLTTSEICVKIAHHFYPFYLEDDEVSFGSVLGQLCSKYFKSFTQVSQENNGTITAYMNKFNQQRINNYKGLTNMIGLLYISDLFPAKIILSCLTTIKKLVIQSNLSQEECDNYYSGYDRLITHLISRFEVKNPHTAELHPHLVEEFFQITDPISEINNEILSTSLENASAENRSDRNNSIRKYSINIHKLTIKKLGKLKESYVVLNERVENGEAASSDSESETESE